MEMNDVGNEWWMVHYLEKLEYKVPKSRPIEGKTKGPYGISSEVFKWSYLTNTILRVIKKLLEIEKPHQCSGSDLKPLPKSRDLSNTND